MTIKAYRYQLRLKPAQQAQLVRWSGGLRWLCNKALAEQKARHARGEPYANYVAMAKWLTAKRHAPESLWLAQGPVHPQQQVLQRLDESYKRFFKGVGGFPRFNARGLEPGLRFPDPKQITLDAPNGRIQLPKLDWLRLRLSRSVEGEQIGRPAPDATCDMLNVLTRLKPGDTGGFFSYTGERLPW